jgi:hypothetical protein
VVDEKIEVEINGAMEVQRVMTLGKSGAAGAPAERGDATILRRVFAVDPLQKQRRMISDAL